MSNNLYEGIKIFIVCVCVLALNTMVTLQLRSRLHLPASSQTPAGSWQSPYGLIVCESSHGAEPSLPLRLSPAARSSSSPWRAKNDLPYLLAEPRKVPSLGWFRWMLLPALPTKWFLWLLTYGLWEALGQRLIDFTRKFSLLQSFSLWPTGFQCITAVVICKAK